MKQLTVSAPLVAAAAVAATVLLSIVYSLLSRLVVVLTNQLPVYFHVLLLINLGLFCWASNVHILLVSGISPNRILQFNNPAATGSASSNSHSQDSSLLSPSHNLPMHSHYSYGQQLSLVPANLYTIATVYSAVTVTAIALFSFVVWLSGGSEETAEFVPLLAYILMIVLLVGLKENRFFGKERKWFLSSLKRIAFGTLTSAVPFCDVVFADILTSFSKVLGDLHLVAEDLLSHESSHDLRYSHHSIAPEKVGNVSGLPQTSPVVASGGTMGGRIIEVIGILLVCLPFVFRLRQCLAEYFQTVNNPSAQTRHLMNALKYCTAFPVIASSWLINWVRAEVSFVAQNKSHAVDAKTKLLGALVVDDSQRIDEKRIEFVLNFAIGIWIFFSIINSVYSLYWDIFVDWQLGQWNRKPANYPVTPRRVNSTSRLPMIQLNSLSTPSLQQQQQQSVGLLSTSSQDQTLIESDGSLDLNLPASSSSTSSSQQTPQPFPFFLRKVLHFQYPQVYYAAIIFNTLLRMSWIVRVAILQTLLKESFWGGGDDTTSGIRGTLLGVDLGLKGLEVLRRWVWVFFRVEREWVQGKERGVVREVKA
ncbi:EXS family-domain-containing protein [Obelidium mucronatum]|nr:EXS family-domain-containing protein [Obelidium mucronatum]